MAFNDNWKAVYQAISVYKAVRCFKSPTKVIRVSNWCLKLLTFQLSNYQEFEIVKCAFAPVESWDVHANTPLFTVFHVAYMIRWFSYDFLIGIWYKMRHSTYVSYWRERGQQLRITMILKCSFLVLLICVLVTYYSVNSKHKRPK